MTGSHSDDTGKWVYPSTSPKFTGSLQISGEISSIMRWLCGLPGGLRFREIDVSHRDDDTPLVVGLVSKCSNTLESPTTPCHDFGVFAIALMIFQFLTAVRECRRATFARPLNGHEAQRCGIRFRGIAPLDQRCSRNHQIKGAPASYRQITPRPSGLSRMEGSRPCAGPTLDLTLDLSYYFTQ